jgi:hypothetical protein
MTRIIAGLILLVALLLVACSPPPFDLSLSVAAKITNTLTYVGQVGPIDTMSNSRGYDDIMFFPEKDGVGGITLQAGFVHSMDPSNGQQVSFIAYDGGQGKYVREGGTQWLGPLPTTPYPDYVVQSMKSLHNVIAFQFDPSSTANNSYTLATGNPIVHTFNSPGWTTLNTFTDVAPFNFSPGRVIGVSIYPDPSLLLDRSYWLFRDSTTNNYYEGEFNISQNPIAPPGIFVRAGGTYDISSFVGNLAKRVLYYYDPVSAHSYVSVWNSPLSLGNWSTWVWIDNLPIPTHWQLTSISHRIDALLTTGELLSTEGNVGRVYDPTTPTGSLASEFPLGALRFIGEVYIAGTPTMLFSLALWYNRQVSFNVYSLPTSQVKTLGR